MSQLYPRTTEQEELSGVTEKLIGMVSPVGKEIGISSAWVMMEFKVPLKSFSSNGGTECSGILCRRTKLGSIKQCVDPESTSARVGEGSENSEEVRGT